MLYRQVNRVHLDDYTHLMDSGLYRRLADEGLIQPHEPADLSVALTDEAAVVLRPQLVPFISYPYEWCFGQLRDAAITTLEIQRLALDYGMSLRDASAFNIQFVGNRPVLIDLTSLGLYRTNQPWVAYRQFCQHFLAPLALMAYRDPSLSSLLACNLDGIPLQLAANLLPWRAKLRPAMFMHLHLHSKSRPRAESGGSRSSQPFTERSMRGLIEGLAAAVGKTRYSLPETGWVAYEAGKDVYNQAASKEKMRLVEELIGRHRPGVVWDLGANTGEYSRIAAGEADLVVSLDYDPATIENSYRNLSTSRSANIVPLVCDLTNPTPALGWSNRERMSLVERGPADMGMALALVHHLAIGANVPFSLQAEFFGALCRTMVVEFVPKSDPMVHKLLAFREDIFTDYDKPAFEVSFTKRFVIEEEYQLPESERILYYMTRR